MNRGDEDNRERFKTARGRSKGVLAGNESEGQR